MDILTEENLNDLIKNQIEESIHLDYKRGDALLKNDRCKTEIAKDISAFANSDGGIIIYGIEEVAHVASSIVPVDGSIITKEWLEQVINTNIDRRISGLIINPIRIGGDVNKVVFVVNIPKSYDAPHMTKEKKLYKRFNFESVQMEEYELRDLYNRPKFNDLEIENCIVETSGEDWTPTPQKHYDPPSKILRLDLHIAFQIKNIGNNIETLYKVEVHTDIYFFNSHAPYNPIQHYYVRSEGDINIYSIPNSSPLFQGEITTVTRASFTLDREQIDNVLEKSVKIVLYYSTGKKEREFKMFELLELSGKKFPEYFR